MTAQFISIITVNYNGKHFLPNFLQSLLMAVKEHFETEIIVVDNVSTDDSVAWIRERHPDVKVIQNDINNYTKAINLGIMSAKGEYITLVNNDAELHPEWLQNLWEAFQTDERTGAVQSKILFSDRRTINSTGVEEAEDFYFRDTGFGEEDAGQYDEAREIDYCSGGSVMLRRRCLEDVGAFDEDFIMFCEDIDFSIRARQAGWKILFCPRSIMYHKYHGSSSNELCDYLCNRNRFLIIAKHFPLKLAESIRTSYFYQRGELNLLYHSLLEAVRKLAQHHGAGSLGAVVDTLCKEITAIFGPLGAHNFFSQLELMLGLRKLRVGIYDHAFHFAGGGQRYVAFMAEDLQEKYDVTYIANKEITLEQYKEWFNIDLSKCSLKIIKIPFFERPGLYFINEGMVLGEKENPFDIISQESLRYDVFINANMLTNVQPLSPISVFICHFPDQEKEGFFAVDQYDYLVTNSRYSTSWTKDIWQLDATHLIYPPVDMYDPDSDPNKKEHIILSVSRFETGGSKKQIEMAKAFIKLAAKDYNVGRTWKLILAGGNPITNPYFDKVIKLVNSTGCNIELKTNLSYDEIKALYKAASIFWHACGLNETEPRWIEHFGMTTVEAMQNYCVPIVINGGGQTEIVQNGINGFTFNTIAELQAHTLKIIYDEALRRDIAEKAYQRSHEFNGEAFKRRVASLFSEIENALMGIDTMVPPHIIPTGLHIVFKAALGGGMMLEHEMAGEKDGSVEAQAELSAREVDPGEYAAIPAEMAEQIEDLEKLTRAFQSSLSWRLTEPLRRVGKLLVSLRSTKETHRGIDTSVKKTLEKVNPESHAVPDRPSVDPPELSQALIARFSTGSCLSRSLIPRIQTVCSSLDPSAEQRFLGIGRHDHWKALQILDEIVERRLSVVDQKVGQFFFAITGCLLSDFDLTRLAFAYHCSSSDKQILLDLLYKEVVSKSQIIDDSLSVEIVPAEPGVLFVDVTHTETYPHISGIQRLVRKCCEAFRTNGLKHKLIRKVQGLRTFELVDKELTMQMNIASAAPFWPAKLVERLRQRVSRSLRALGILWPIKLYRRLRQLRWPSFEEKTIRVPLLSGGTVLLPEVCADEERPELYLQLKRHFPVTVGMVCYDLIPMVHPEYCAPTTFVHYLQTLRVADRISCISEHIRQQFEHFMNLVDRDDHPSRLGVHSLAGDICPARRGTELPDGIGTKPLILSVGTLEPRKNHVGIMRAAKLLWNRGLEFKLVIAGGKGWQNDRILSEAEDAVRAGYDLQIIFDISEPELARLYEAARFTVFCSFTEGFGLPILESHAFGKPCVTSNIGSMAEIARDGGCLLVDPRSPISIAEGILQLIENESLYSKLCEEIRTKRTCTWNEYAMELYRFFIEPLPRDRCPFG